MHSDLASDPRLQSVALLFKEQFGTPCHVVARAPGRVNAIGEHVDYSGGSVLPLAVSQDCVVALSMDESLTGIQLRSTRPQQYTPIDYSTDPQQPVDTKQHVWGNYVLAAYKGVHEHLAARASHCGAHAGAGPHAVAGFRILVDGSIPEGAGLSSSSALVVASMLALLEAYGQLGAMTKSDVAKLASRSERHVGTEGGGMDQAVSLLAHQGCALHVRFDQPQLQVEPVKLPPNVCFAVCHSLVEAHKAQGAVTKFNTRVAECRLAAKVLQHLLHPQPQASVRVLGQVVPMLSTVFGSSLPEMCEGVQGLLHPQGYSVDEVSALCGGQPLEQLLEAGQSSNLPDAVCCTANESQLREDGAWRAAPCLFLQQRALHFLSECQRVLDFIVACREASTTLEDLGALLTSSHRSCADLYDCSCPELEALVAAATAAGAKGARLTGAGWGGCVVCLLHTKEVDAFLQKLWHSHYANRTDKEGQPVLLGKCVFCVDPAGGAAVCRVSG